MDSKGNGGGREGGVCGRARLGLVSMCVSVKVGRRVILQWVNVMPREGKLKV